MRFPRSSRSRHRHKLRVGDVVKVATSLRCLAHPEYRKVFRRVAGRVTTIVGWDATGGAWVPIQGCEVVTVEPHLLRVVRRGPAKHVRYHVGA